MKALIPVFGLIAGGAIGGYGGHVLKPPPDEETSVQVERAEEDDNDVLAPDAAATDLLEIANQFIVPVVEDGAVTSMAILSVGLELKTGTAEGIYAREAKLRDLILRALFEHARLGGFSGDFANPANLDLLRSSLLEAVREEFGQNVLAVLITDLARRDT